MSNSTPEAPPRETPRTIEQLRGLRLKPISVGKLEDKPVPTAEELKNLYKLESVVRGATLHTLDLETAESNEMMAERKTWIEEYLPTFNKYLIKPSKAALGWMKEHPKTTAAIIAAVGVGILFWYFSAPIAYGLSGVAEEALQVIQETMSEASKLNPKGMEYLPGTLPPIPAPIPPT